MTVVQQKTNSLERFQEVFEGGATGLFIGPPGTGKSMILGSVGEMIDPKEVVLICTKPTEVNSALYRKYGFSKNAHVFQDRKWRPSVGVFEADGYRRMMDFVYSLQDREDVGVVLFDPITDAVDLVAHKALKAEQASSPRELRDPISYYSAMAKDMKELVTALMALSSKEDKRPKHVFCTVHAQPTKEEDIKGKETPEGRAKGISFFGDALPMIEGGYRQAIAGEFDIVGFTSVKHEVVREGTKMLKKTRYIVQLAPDNERHAKVRLAPSLLEKELDNSLPKILEAVLAAEAA